MDLYILNASTVIYIQSYTYSYIHTFLKSGDSYGLLYTGITDRLISLNNAKCRKYPSCAMSFARIKSVSYFSGKTAEKERTTVR